MTTSKEGIVRTPKEFSDALTLDLTDEEITRALQITLPIKRKWQERFRAKLRHGNFTVEEAMKLVNDFENEITYELATKADIVAHVDVEPVFLGEPPVIEFTGRASGGVSEFDHEKKEWEVKKAKELGEDFLGSKHLE